MGSPDGEPLTTLTTSLGVDIDPGLLELALTHRSYAYENGGLPTNERLEFLGDSVLGLVVTDALYRRNPELPEGQLAKMRASVVSTRALAGIARTLGVGSYVRLGRGERSTGGEDKASILADTMEALIGAAYLSHGIDVARQVVLRLVDPVLSSPASISAGQDWKTRLQEMVADLGLGAPAYAVDAEGPDHAKVFHATVTIGREALGRGTGSSKKDAEQRAASQAWEALGARHPDAAGKAP